MIKCPRVFKGGLPSKVLLLLSFAHFFVNQFLGGQMTKRRQTQRHPRLDAKSYINMVGSRDNKMLNLPEVLRRGWGEKNSFLPVSSGA